MVVMFKTWLLCSLWVITVRLGCPVHCWKDQPWWEMIVWIHRSWERECVCDHEEVTQSLSNTVVFVNSLAPALFFSLIPPSVVIFLVNVDISFRHHLYAFFFLSCLFLSRRPRPPHPDRRGNSHSAVTSKWFHPLPVFQLMMCRLPSSFDVEWSCMCVRWERRRRKNKVGPEIRKNPHVLLLDDYESIQKSCVFHVLSERRVHWRFEGPPV